MNLLSNAFGIHEQALQVRSQRLEVLARNIANADTPNYKAQDLDFKAMLKEVKKDVLTATHAKHYAAVAEALHLAERLGLNRTQVVEARKGGAAGSWALTHRSDRMINDEYPLGFKLALHRKDLGIALASAAEQQLELPVSQLVAAMEDQLMQEGLGDLDVSVLARWFRS